MQRLPARIILLLVTVAIVASLASGTILHFGGVALNLFADWLGFWERWKSITLGAIVLGIIAGALSASKSRKSIFESKSTWIGIAFGFLPLLVGFAYCLLISVVSGFLIGKFIGQKSCRSGKAFTLVGALHGLATYGVHILINLLQGNTFTPVGLTPPGGGAVAISIIEWILIVVSASIASYLVLGGLEPLEPKQNQRQEKPA